MLGGSKEACGLAERPMLSTRSIRHPKSRTAPPSSGSRPDKIDQRPHCGDVRKNRYRQPLLADEHADKFGSELLEHDFRAKSEPIRPAPRNKAANKSGAKFCPGQAMPTAAGPRETESHKRCARPAWSGRSD